MFDCVRVGKEIAAMRKSKGLTQEEVACRLNISPQAVSKWENGRAMPDLALLVELAELFGSSLDGILFPGSQPSANANFEHILLPYAPIADFSGRNWPRSMAFPAVLAAVKLFMGLEKQRDSMGRQINDDAEYVLQSAFTCIGFGYSWGRDDALESCLPVYGLAGEVHRKGECSEEEFIHLAVKNILDGYPVIVIPNEYTDIILATGFSDKGKVLKGIPFLDGDDEKNSVMSFQQLKNYPEWYTRDFSLLLIRPGPETVPVAGKCGEALRQAVSLLGNRTSISAEPLVGYGLVIYDHWCEELQRESNQGLAEIGCLSPHIFIHYEGKLRIKQFLELCPRLLDNLDSRAMLAAVSKYQEIIELCEKFLGELSEHMPETVEEANEKRRVLIAVLQRSKELEEEALGEISSAISGGA